MARTITADDFMNFHMVSDPRFSPDGSRIAFVKRRTDKEKSKYAAEIWMATVGGGAPQQFTGAAGSDGTPCWSPDGSCLAFLSDRKKPKNQIFVISANGGEARALTHNEVEGSFSSLAWSPDGSKIAFLFRRTPSEYTKEAAEERKKSELPSPVRVHTALNYRYDGFGFWDNEFHQVGVADAVTGDIQILTEGPYNCSGPIWSPDSQVIAFVSDRNDDADLVPGRSAIYLVPATGGEIAKLATPLGYKGSLSWSPDGTTFAFLGSLDLEDPWGTRNSHLFVMPSSGSETAIDLLAGVDLTTGYYTLGDSHDSGAGDSIQWSADSKTLYFPISSDGDTMLASVPITGGQPTFLSPRNAEMGGFSVGSTGAICAVLSSHTSAQEIGLVKDGAFAAISAFNSWLGDVQTSVPRPIDVDNGDGGKVPGWLLCPPDFDPSRKYPLVLYIHGGPHAQYGATFFHELQWLATEGFAVLYTNPRGSKGYGEEHTRAIWANWGGPDYKDLMLATDWAVSQPYIDADRTAVMGGSYGGYMTALIVGRTNRFHCAIADRLVANRHSMSGTTDFAWRHEIYFEGNSWDNPQPLLNCSPLSYAANVNTPLLLIHSDGDLRCPAGQAEEMFAALRLQRKTVEYVRYPAETSHGMSRNGPPSLRLDRLQRNLAWLRRHLGAS